MEQRAVSEEQVERVLDAPDSSQVARRPGARKLTRAFGTRRLTVIVEREAGFIRIVTVYWK
jgi:hypothetical protein